LALRRLPGAAPGPPARLAPVRDGPAPRALVDRPEHALPDPAHRQHRRDPPLPARLPAPVLSRAVRVRSRAVSGGGKCRKAPGDAPALPHDEPRRSGRRAARPRQGLRPLREIGHGARWPTARDEPVPGMNLQLVSDIVFALGRCAPRAPFALLRAMPPGLLHALRAPGLRETFRV